MIIVNLKGGLGNQMFQYALGRALSISNDDDLSLDTGGLDRANAVGDIYRPFALSSFSIKAGVAGARDVRRLKYPFGIFSKIARRFRFAILRQTQVGWEPDLLAKRGDIYLDGYFQSPKYFEGIRDILINDFTLKEPLSPAGQSLLAQIEADESVAVHVRRGDYVSNAKVRDAYGPCPPDYYERAMKEIQERVALPVWFVFSDDVDWVKANIPFPDGAVYVSGQDIPDTHELMLMAACKHTIIANSTFSWWGAWLNRNPDKVVIAPAPWFDTKKDRHKDLIPYPWIRVPKN